MPKRRKRKRSSRSAPRSSEYQQAVRQADELLAENHIEIRSDNWQQLVLDWVTPDEPELGEMARYIADHEGQLGVPWAREMLRLEVLIQAEDYMQIVTHYNQVLSHYSRCALVEMRVADYVYRHATDFWRARRMYRYVIEHLPDHPKPYYEMGFMSYLLGDFSGAVNWYDQAVDLVGNCDAELEARILYNRAMVRFCIDSDKKTAIAEIKRALKRMPDYPQAKQALRGLRGRVRWTTW
jgi:tetratricopeptide (TPR) repeat protein